MYTSLTKTILFVGGGSGGHLFPGIAVAEKLRLHAKNCRIVFFVTTKRIDAKIIQQTPYTWYTCPTIPFPKRRNLTNCTSFAQKFAMGLWKSEHVLRMTRPSCVVSLGGFGAFAAVILAILHKVPHVHLEGNAIAGKVVRYLCPWSNAVFCHYENCFGVLQDKIVWSGLPIRSNIFKEMKLSTTFTILVMGGSQGATFMEENVLRSLRHLTKSRHKISFIHIAGKKSQRSVVAQYKKFGFRAKVYSFVSHMKDIYRETDLAISRAGASTIAEVTALGIPTILVPFAKAADNHQYENSLYMEKRNATIVMEEKELTPESIAQKIVYLTNNRQKLSRMSFAAKKIAKPHGATIVSDYIVKNFLGS
ncbi:undecaprenyldiphospho-muramoylpentapeptide beta-N-acetylglucosaminyltransferase [Candidatus Uabimicrobium amorphum]|uniref:UDP-N-acetylglucosamine--N-acetylmuramyl-(pentapeptide) pyrophosphoryl-undecaprenol N-acetylglucosamine transferase n=1 Tax=Uabimicrobium amorphum TaxID=2596890 RepID=A0A5S9IMU6_UABAM|nr:undecaprenyldiphospho-muramoylpentapeptide beta-N-acetylglucosaminyltransferase [Candidatus Uabimicrobium amorphum]BBM83455.1 UDP-N-acetylglucosamine--N-acetylmuramyl-(pentapeptide) pyrophosphoryl-undecaprenolN-acetylglucosamine transferase [Candidatus Uabimicrobium amorphum]